MSLRVLRRPPPRLHLRPGSGRPLLEEGNEVPTNGTPVFPGEVGEDRLDPIAVVERDVAPAASP